MIGLSGVDMVQIDNESSDDQLSSQKTEKPVNQMSPKILGLGEALSSRRSLFDENN